MTQTNNTDGRWAAALAFAIAATVFGLQYSYQFEKVKQRLDALPCATSGCCDPQAATSQQLLHRSLTIHAHRIAELNRRVLCLERPAESVTKPRNPGRLGSTGRIGSTTTDYGEESSDQGKATGTEGG